MRPSRPLVAALAGAALGLLACGGDTPAPHCSPPRASPSAPTVSSGHLTAVADRAVVPAGGSVAVAVQASGPWSFVAPCEGPVSLIVIDRTGIHVDALAPPAPKGTPCGTVTLAAGETAEYEVVWNADPTLPPGPYRLVLGLGDQPQLVLTVRLGLEFGSGCG